MMRRTIALGMSILAAALPLNPASAQIVLSNLIVELLPGKDSKQDVEVWNNSDQRTYVAVEPAEIVNPGTPAEARRTDPDPQQLGILVSPARMILEPGQRKLVRMAEITAPAERERVYRVTVKPVVGPISSEESGLKILLGYDVLVLVRPASARPNVTFTRSGNTGTFRNNGNVSVELVEGRECDSSGKACSELSAKRLYPGASWSTPLQPGRSPSYVLKSVGPSVRKTF